LEKYINMLLDDDREKMIDHVYGVYFSENGTFSDKQFDIDTNDFMIIDVIKYKSTPGLYELIFKRIPDTIYTENDKLAYKNMLLVTNAHRRNHNPILGNKGYKYKNIIVSLVSGKIQVGMGIPCAWKLNK